MLGLRGTYDKVVTANGPAQLLTYSFWGVLMAGMLHGVCEMCIPNELLIFWGAVSAAVVPITIWCSQAWLRNILLIDAVTSCYIMMVMVMHEPHTIEPIYHSFGVEGMATHRRTEAHGSLSEWFHVTSLIWMTLHALYLADLVNRQMLEQRRFNR